MKKIRNYVCILALIDYSVPIGVMGRVSFYNRMNTTWSNDIKDATRMSIDEAKNIQKDLNDMMARANMSIDIQFA